MEKIRLVESITYLGLAFNKEYTGEEIELYYNFLKEYEDITLTMGVKELIKKNKYLPKISEIIEECDKQENNKKILILERMKNEGYFKSANEYEKAIMWIEEGVTPEWLIKDIDMYNRQEILVNNSMIMLGDNYN